MPVIRIEDYGDGVHGIVFDRPDIPPQLHE